MITPTLILLLFAALCFLRAASAPWFTGQPRFPRPDFTDFGFFFTVIAVISILYGGR